MKRVGLTSTDDGLAGAKDEGQDETAQEPLPGRARARGAAAQHGPAKTPDKWAPKPTCLGTESVGVFSLVGLLLPSSGSVADRPSFLSSSSSPLTQSDLPTRRTRTESILITRTAD